MARHESAETFEETLAALEEQLELPMVPGELANRLDIVENYVGQVVTALTTERAANHDKLLSEMKSQDMALATKVDTLRAEHGELVAGWQQWKAKLTQLQTQASRAEPDEAEVRDAAQTAIDQALALVIKTRKHDAAVATWYTEAFNRDRGMGD